jgi:hypothetical protein
MHLRGHWLHGLSSVVKASVDGSLIQLSSDREYRDRLRAVFLFARLFVCSNPSKLLPLGHPRDPRSDQDHSERCAQAAGRDAIDAAGYERRNFVHLALSRTLIHFKWISIPPKSIRMVITFSKGGSTSGFGT